VHHPLIHLRHADADGIIIIVRDKTKRPRHELRKTGLGLAEEELARDRGEKLVIMRFDIVRPKPEIAAQCP
jgi:hypothetical protein